MKKLLIILLLIFILWQTKERFTEPDVHIINGPNVARTVTLYYTNWCNYCKNMRPVWDLVKVNASKDIKFVEVDGDKEKTPGVNAYPTIWMVVDHKMYEYKGGPNYQELYRWVMTVKPEYVQK